LLVIYFKKKNFNCCCRMYFLCVYCSVWLCGGGGGGNLCLTKYLSKLKLSYRTSILRRAYVNTGVLISP